MVNAVIFIRRNEKVICEKYVWVGEEKERIENV